MPSHGHYDTSRATTRKMSRATQVKHGKLLVYPSLAKPSYCSGATYLVFLLTLLKLGINLDSPLAEKLVIADVADGLGSWGHWNANGPGTARLFHKLKLGQNFESWNDAQPGDFLKIFWSNEIGVNESGHSVILVDKAYGQKNKVKFWSSNHSVGYGFKVIDRSKITWAIFSRLTHPQNIRMIPDSGFYDEFLAAMLHQTFQRDQVRQACGIVKTITPPPEG